jgi:hypothetical protein
MARHPTQLTIRDERNSTSSSSAAVKIDESGDLVFEGVETGPAAEQCFGDSDYEYWLRVRAADKDAVLLHLIKAQFTSVHAFRTWLAERGITSELTSF